MGVALQIKKTKLFKREQTIEYIYIYIYTHTHTHIFFFFQSEKDMANGKQRVWKQNAVPM